MTADTSLTDAFLQVFGAPTFELPRDDATYEDGPTLERSHRALSRRAQQEQRSGGPYFPQVDEQGYDRDGWAWGPR